MILGCSQIKNIDYNETFLLVAKETTFSFIMLAQVLQLIVHQLNVDSVFLYAGLDDDIWMVLPDGYTSSEKSDQAHNGVNFEYWIQTIHFR